MKAILIDDERPALLQLEWLLAKEPDIEVTGSYQHAADGLKHLARERVELVFLDMEMPGMNGLEAAEAIAALDEEIRVIFVTAYSSYALEAFKVNALDYVLKPIDPQRFAKTLERVRKSHARAVPPPHDATASTAAATAAEAAAQVAAKPELEMLGQLRISAANGQSAGKWRTLKSKELFAYLLHNRGLWLAKDALLEEIWPAFEQDKALVHLHTAVYQVRRMLRDTGLGATLEYSLESYRLQGDELSIDADRFQQAAAAAAEGKQSDAEAAKAWALYNGHYLDKEDYAWAKPRRETLLQSYIALTLQLVASERANGAPEAALRRIRRACELHPYSERLTRELLACLATAGDMEALRRSYAAFCKLIADELGSEPSADFQFYSCQLLERIE
ncbi:response regulator [Paenibacillus athensensis]|uniref:Response regulatory domain-containing protein n=1 Tax=Paenibacillus athensensis TaxID=1967502 RepID=A0A4Y8PVW6_9BACL|nr:response regulator [Paenibacillus athensensis]MCD1259434.1 response regulator [Paenibacillus athensensis]